MAAIVKNVVFEGTGVRNPAYAGGLLALAEAGLFDGIEAAAGTSSGSIVATMVSLGYSAEEIRKAILDLDFSKLLDGSFVGGAWRVLTGYGWHKGDYFLARIEDIIAAKTGDGRATFAQCKARGFKALHVVGTNITKRSVRVFPDDTSQDMAIADAVRISMSIPLFFVSRTYQGDVYVDGGVLWNYALGFFDGPGDARMDTIGFRVSNSRISPANHTRNFHDYAAGLLGCIIREQSDEVERRPIDQARSVTIGDGGILPTRFDITNGEKQGLIDAGLQATRTFLRARPDVRDARVNGPGPS